TVGPALEWTVGWGYSGSGSSLSGVTTTAVSNLTSSAAAESTARICTISAGDGRVAINLGNGAAAACGFLIIIERNIDQALTPMDMVTMYSQFWIANAQSAFQTVTPDAAYLNTSSTLASH